MPIVDFGRIESDATPEQIIEALAKIQKGIDYLMQGGLDSKNAREFGGWLVGNTELQSRDKAVGMSTESTGADDIRFWAGDLKAGAPKFSVTKSGIFSAIGGLIKSAFGYPRIELNSGSLFAAYQSATNFVQINPNLNGTPTISVSNGTLTGIIQIAAGQFLINSTVGSDLQVTGGTNLRLSAGSSVIFNTSSLIMNGATAFSGSFSYVKYVDFATSSTINGSVTVTNGIVTNVT